MANAYRAVKAAFALADQFRPLYDLQDELDELGGVEKLIAARQAELASFDGRIEQAKQSAQEETRKAKEKTDLAAAEGAQIAKNAAAIYAKAQADAERIVGEARTTADNLMADAERQVSEMAARVVELKDQIGLLENSHHNWVKDEEMMKARLAAIKADIARIRENLSN